MKQVIILHSESMGKGDDILGQKLIGSFLRQLWASDIKPEDILFYNSAVKVLKKGSVHTEALQQLEAAGVELLACGTCVEYFSMEDEMVAGRVSNMQEISSIMLKAEKVITI